MKIIKVVFLIIIFAPLFLFFKVKNIEAQTCVSSGGFCVDTPDDCNCSSCTYDEGNQECVDMYLGGCCFDADIGVSPVNWEWLHFFAMPTLWDELDSGGVGALVNVIVRYVFPFAGLLLLLYLIYGGFMYLTSAGDPQKAKTASGIITTALLGFVIVFVSFWVVEIVAYVLGLEEITTVFGG